MTLPARLGVLLSGRGSNFLALHAAIERGELPAQIAMVITDKPEAGGLACARELGYRTAVMPATSGADRKAHEALIVEQLRDAGVEWVCLAGYMRLLSPLLLAAFPYRIVNIHPSLLPAFPGLHAQRQAWEHGVRVAGCTVHLVDEGLDSGPIVVQRAVPVEDAADAGALATRILAEEHRAYPEALRRLLTEDWTVEGRRLVFAGGSASDAGANSAKKRVDTLEAPPYNLPSRDGKPPRDAL